MTRETLLLFIRAWRAGKLEGWQLREAAAEFGYPVDSRAEGDKESLTRHLVNDENEGGCSNNERSRWCCVAVMRLELHVRGFWEKPLARASGYVRNLWYRMESRGLFEPGCQSWPASTST